MLLTYPESNYINRIYRKYNQTRSEFEFMTQNRRLHKLWIIDDDLDIENIEKEFDKINKLYVLTSREKEIEDIRSKATPYFESDSSIV